jgi:glyoxylase-like metal-dependent hydrolase (beta-lactamase superfamily II)
VSPLFTLQTLDAYNPGPMTATGNHTYLLAANGAALLIDAGTGAPQHLAALGEALDSAGARLTRVLVTHAHPDHASGAPALREAHPGAVFMKMRWPGEDEHYAVTWTAIVDGQEFAVGDTLVRAVYTPGHSPDHLAFWEPSTRTCFSGDLVIRNSSVMIHASGGGDLSAYLESLERLRQLRPARLMPAHGAEIDDPDTVLRDYLAHRLMREQQVLSALEAGRQSVPAIAESIYHGLDPALLPAAQENVRAHLEKLRREGRAFEDDGRWRL